LSPIRISGRQGKNETMEKLFSTFQLKSLNTRNRFVMSPMTRSFSPQGIPSPEVADYYGRRSAAEVGLII